MSVELAGGRFDSNDFNAHFTQYMQDQKTLQTLNEKKRLGKLDSSDTTKSLMDMTISELLANGRQAWANFINDLIDRKYGESLKGNRPFYIGITVLVVIIALHSLHALST
jgi:hypothetical protein